MAVNILFQDDNKIFISKTVYEQISASIGSLPPECGGILGGNRQYIQQFYFDEQAKQEGRRYTPNVEYINQVILPRWGQSGIRLMGWIHSHPSGCIRLSASDQNYLRKILNYLHERDKSYHEMDAFIVQSTIDHETFELHAYRMNIWTEENQELVIKIVKNNERI